jgi:tetratricopeptide (TPR) repeat protein
MLLAESKVKFGLLMLEIAPSSPAERSGLRPRDIIVEYAGLPVRDITSYVAAALSHQSDHGVTLTVWRDDGQVKLTAPTGYLGFLSDDWNPARKQIYESLARGDRKAAEQLAAVAERSATLTEVQALIVRIMLIPNRSSAEKEKQRSDLLDSLLSVYPINHLTSLATREFYTLKSYAAAARCYEEQLQRYDPEDVNIRLNLALSYVSLFDFDKADRHVHYIVDRPDPRLSQHGYFVARTVLGSIASARRRYSEALSLFSENIDTGDEYSIMMALLAAAKLGNTEKFDEIHQLVSKLPTEQVNRMSFFVDTLRAYLLMNNGHRQEGTALIRKWGTSKCIVETATPYWSEMPGGAEIPSQLEAFLGNA